MITSDPRWEGPWQDVLPDPVPSVHRNLDGSRGGVPVTTLTRDVLDHLLSTILWREPNPFLVLARDGQQGAVQTYRAGRDHWDVEWLTGEKVEVDGQPRNEILTMSTSQQSVVADLMWAWLEGDLTLLQDQNWAKSFH